MSRPPRSKPHAPPSPAHPAGHLLAEFEPLLPAEEKLREGCHSGSGAIISDERPAAMTEANRVRAGVLRVCCLGLDPTIPVHEQGVLLMGAWIDGALDLAGCEITRRVIIAESVLADDLELMDASIVAMSLGGSGRAPGRGVGAVAGRRPSSIFA